jgi:type IV pilus assembly protein PilW
MKPLHTTTRIRLSSLRQQAGRTLLELMISITIGLVIIGAAMAIYAGTSSSSKVSETEARLNENATITLGLLQQQIRLAGYSAIMGPPAFPITQRKNLDGTGSAGIRGCTGGMAVTNTTAFNAITCNDTSASDSLAIRYEADTFNTIPVTAGGILVPSNCVGEGVTATTVSSATATAAIAGTLTIPNYALADNRYYVQTAGTPSGGPELYCVGAISTNTTTGVVTFGTPQPIMEGVERMEISFGVAGTSTGTITTAYMTAQALDAALPAEADRWKRVISARVCLQLRNTASSDLSKRSAIDDTAKYYDCSNTQQTSTDGYLRRTYTSTILLKNRLQQ